MKLIILCWTTCLLSICVNAQPFKLRVKRTTQLGYVTEYFMDRNGLHGGEFDIKLVFSNRNKNKKVNPAGIFVHFGSVTFFGKDYQLAQPGAGIGYQGNLIRAIPRLSFQLSATVNYYAGIVYEDFFDGKKFYYGGSFALSYSVRKKFGPYIKFSSPAFVTKATIEKSNTYPQLLSAGIQF